MKRLLVGHKSENVDTKRKRFLHMWYVWYCQLMVLKKLNISNQKNVTFFCQSEVPLVVSTKYNFTAANFGGDALSAPETFVI